MGLGVWVQNQHQGEDRCFQQNKITKAAAFLCFVSHRSQGRKVLLFSTLLLCPPDPSLHPRALGNKPPLPPDEEQGAGSGSSPAGRALPHLSTPCRLQPSPWHSLCFPICLPSHPSSLLLLPGLFLLLCFPATPTALLDGWLAPSCPVGAPWTCLCQEGRLPSLPPLLPPPPADAAPRPGSVTPPGKQPRRERQMGWEEAVPGIAEPG